MSLSKLFCVQAILPRASQFFPARLLAAYALAAAGWLASSAPVQAAPQVLTGHVPPITKQLKSIGRLDSDMNLDLAIGLPLRNREQLTNLLEKLYKPSDASFRHYLTPDQFASSFGPSQADYQAVMDFAKSHGLTVKKTHSNRTLVDVSGSVADIEKAFHVHIRVYQHPVEARTFFAPDAEPSLDLDTPVLAISGLDDYVKPRPQISPLGGGSGGGGGGAGGSGPGGTYLGYDYRAAYASGVSLTGAGQSVALFELSGYDPADIEAYESEANLPNVALTNFLIDGYDGDDTNVDYAVEVTADIEMAISMAPGLDSVFVYEGPTPLYEAPLGTNAVQWPFTTAQINDVFNQIATDDLANQINCSYLMDINLSTVQIFQQFAAQGQSFFQGSGDAGAYPAAIDEPADDPYVTVVGGTTLNTSGPEGSWESEVVWLTPASEENVDGFEIPVPYAATGGGVSLTYGIPSYQQGISMTANQGSTTMRNLPDVALVANNVDIVYGSDYYPLGPYFGALGPTDFTEAGTSLATPLWAAFMALVNEQAAANGQPPVGFANPALYAIAKSTNYHACFHDITIGVNTNLNSPSKYAAKAGYDLCTGWGTLIGTNLMPALLAPPSENLVISPPLGFTSVGAGGGPFSVTSQTYTVANAGSTLLSWSLVNTSPWLTVSGAPGTLKPGDSAAVTVSLNSAASNILIDSYSGNVSFVDLGDATVQNRQFDLYVGNGGFETGDFTDWNFVGSTNQTFPLCGDDVDVAGTNALTGEPDELFVHSGLYGAYLGESPTDGSLSQAVATTPGQPYLVSFWLTSVPYEGLTTPNDFTASWNGSTLFYQTNLEAFDWTNMQYVVSATAASTTLQFDFNNVPGAFGLDDVTVVPVAAAPVLQTASVAGGAITFTWSGPAGSYQIQSVGNLSVPNWTNVTANITTNGGLMSASEPIGTASQQFYRVILLAP